MGGKPAVFPVLPHPPPPRSGEGRWKGHSTHQTPFTCPLRGEGGDRV